MRDLERPLGRKTMEAEALDLARTNKPSIPPAS
ncbi:hypothetical protein J2X36_004758 [Methylobacterium sp. BE186]|nr:hypothetical protein [Methylobacterium sp. BE186]